MSFTKLPLDLVRGFTDAIQSLTEFPVILERTLRDTNAAIADLRLQLAGLQSQMGRIAAQLETMRPALDTLVERTAPLIDAAEGARRELAGATERLVVTTQSLERIVQMAAPLDLVGKRVVDRFRRVTGGGSTESSS